MSAVRCRWFALDSLSNTGPLSHSSDVSCASSRSQNIVKIPHLLTTCRSYSTLSRHITIIVIIISRGEYCNLYASNILYAFAIKATQRMHHKNRQIDDAMQGLLSSAVQSSHLSPPGVCADYSLISSSAATNFGQNICNLVLQQIIVSIRLALTYGAFACSISRCIDSLCNTFA